MGRNGCQKPHKKMMSTTSRLSLVMVISALVNPIRVSASKASRRVLDWSLGGLVDNDNHENQDLQPVQSRPPQHHLIPH